MNTHFLKAISNEMLKGQAQVKTIVADIILQGAESNKLHKEEILLCVQDQGLRDEH